MSRAGTPPQYPEAFFPAPDPAALTAHFAARLAEPGVTCLLAGDPALGYALCALQERPLSVFSPPVRRLMVEHIAVAPQARRQGIGRALLAAARGAGARPWHRRDPAGHLGGQPRGACLLWRGGLCRAPDAVPRHALTQPCPLRAPARPRISGKTPNGEQPCSRVLAHWATWRA